MYCTKKCVNIALILIVALIILLVDGIIGEIIAAGPTSVTISNRTGARGDTITVTINVDSLQTIAGYDIYFTYDNTVLTATNAVKGDLAGNIVSNLSAPGEVRLGFVTTDGKGSTSSSPGVLATVTFNVLSTANKSSALTVMAFHLSDENANPIAGVSSTNGAFTLDITPPTGSVSINGNATYTTTPYVTLTLAATDDYSGVSQMCVSSTTTCANWETYATSKAWTLLPGDGLKTVYVWFQDRGGNITTTPYSATITLDTLTTTAQPRGNIFSVPLTVILTANKAATVYYTTDGNVPTTSSPHGASPVTININSTTVLKFFADDGTAQTSVSMERYVILPSGWGAFDAKWQSSFALKSDGTLWAWGSNYLGKLGLGNYDDKHSPTQVGSDSTWVAMTSGYRHALALKSDGTLWAWGNNDYGQLGLGNTGEQIIPTQVGSDTTWAAVAAGQEYTLALKANGTLWAWGNNDYGQLGLGNTETTRMPTQVGTDTTWVTVATGPQHALALKSDGSLWAWGANFNGQLGVGDNTNRSSPTRIGSDTTWVAVAGGVYHTLALKSDGTLWAWGWGDTNSITPTQFGSDTTWVTIAAGYSHTLALKSDGTLWAWGSNANGELGVGDNTNRSLPMQVGSENKFVAVAAGYNHTLALKSDGSLWAWGSNYFGQLGDGTTTQRNSPILVDIYPPTNPTISINGSADYTNSLNVTLTLAANDTTGISEVCISNSTTCTTWVTYAQSQAWILDAGEGMKNVYVWFKDFAGNVSSMASASITLDTTSPQGSFSVNDGILTYTTSQNVILHLSATDNYGVAAYFTSENGTLPSQPNWVAVSPNTSYNDIASFNLSSSDGQKTVYVWFKDVAGNISSRLSRQITLDTGPPPSSGTSISIKDQGGNALTTTKSQIVTLTLAAPDAGTGTVQVGISNDGNNYEWRDFTQTTTWAMTDGDGDKIVYVRFKDGAGFVSDPATYSIRLDTTNPVPVITQPVNDSVLIDQLFAISGTVTDSSPSGGLSTIELQVAGGGYYLTTNPSAPWVTTPTFFTPGEGAVVAWSHNTSGISWLNDTTYTITAQATDQAGNVGTASAHFSICQFQPATSLSMDVSSQMILNNGTVSVAGKLTRLPDTGKSLNGLPIKLVITDPAGASRTVDWTTNTDAGHYVFENISGFTQPGPYSLQAQFVSTGCLQGTTALAKSVIVGRSAGYAVIVEGKLSGQHPEGLDSHNKTANRIYRKLRERGLVDDNIYYFNYNTTTQPAGIVVDEAPTKERVQWAITTWPSTINKMNEQPAPLYIIMVDHGMQGEFYLNDKTISPSELSSWLDALEANLNQEARQEKIITIIGACYSGSFIPSLSKPNTNRIIITSAAADEESYKGLVEDDGKRSGEYFLDEFFTQLGKGYSFKDSFEEATAKTREFTRQGGNVNSMNKYLDTSVQHPLLDDNGDGKGSNLLTQGIGDGQLSRAIYLGTGPTYNTNAAGNSAEVVDVTETQYLNYNTSSAGLWLKASVPWSKISMAGFVVRPPTMNLQGSGTAQSEQRYLNLDTHFMSYDSGSGHWTSTYDFTGSGMYEVFYFVKDNDTGEISPIKRSVVYKDYSGNQPPSAFTLVSPENNEETKTVLVFQWNPSTDPDGDGVTYNLVIKDTNGAVVYRKEGISTTMTYVDSTAIIKDGTTGLKDGTAYFWQVEAVDSFGKLTPSSTRSFRTNNTNFIPGIIQGIVFSDQAAAKIAAAEVTATIGSYTKRITTGTDGNFVLDVAPGDTVSIACVKGGYQIASITNVVVQAGSSTSVNIPLSVSAGAGDLNGDTKVDLADAILALQFISGITTTGTVHKEADVNGDGRIGMAEVIYIMQKIAVMR